MKEKMNEIQDTKQNVMDIKQRMDILEKQTNAINEDRAIRKEFFNLLEWTWGCFFKTE